MEARFEEEIGRTEQVRIMRCLLRGVCASTTIARLAKQAHASELEELEATYRAKITAEMERYDALVKASASLAVLPRS